jgi:hypothetical protein
MSNIHHQHQLLIDAKNKRKEILPELSIHYFKSNFQYWSEVLYNACENHDFAKIKYAKEKLDFFYERLNNKIS